MPPRVPSILFFFLVASVVLPADEPPLITDRPDQTESPSIVPRGLLQLEAGATYLRNDRGATDVTALAVPESLLRWGLTDTFELRLFFAGFAVERTSSDMGQSSKEDGFAFSALGVKVAVAEGKGAVPKVALLGALTFPTGTDAFSTERVDPSFRFAFSNTLTERLSLGYNLGATWLTIEDSLGVEDTVAFANWTVVLGISASERVGVFTELFGRAPLSGDGRTRTSFNTGMTYLLTRRLQLDANVSAGLSDAAPDWTAGVGVSFRFPRR
jgi:hypothetical protein